MKKITAMVFVCCVLMSVSAGFAETPQYDPLARNLIFVEGSAELTVPVNGFSLTLDFDIEKASFTEDNQRAEEIIKAIQQGASALGLKEVEVIKGWDVVRQYKISFGSKGKKISNRLIVKVKNFPQGKLHETLAKMIDQTLAVDGAISLVNVNVFLTDSLENQKKEDALADALKALRSNADKAALALGRSINAPKRVFVTSESSVNQGNLELGMSDYAAPAAATMMRQSFVSVQKSFKVESQVADQVKITARVAGTYQID